MFDRVALRVLDGFIEATFTRAQRVRLGRHIQGRASGDNNGDSRTNGEYTLLRAMSTWFPAQAVLFDVGCNVGEWAAYASKLCPGRQIYAFEPSLATFEKIRELAQRPEYSSKILPFRTALGEEDGTAHLHVFGELACTNSLYHRSLGQQGTATREEVQIRRGDVFCLEHGINHIGYLKIDTEGHELAVMRGFSTHLAEHRISCVQFEYGGTWIDARVFLGDAFNLLVKYGYRVGKLHSGGVEFFDRYEQGLETFVYANYVGVVPELVRSVPTNEGSVRF